MRFDGRRDGNVAGELGAAFHESAESEGVHDLGGLLRNHTGTMNNAKKTTLKTKAQ
jgi:hypothetical protein